MALTNRSYPPYVFREFPKMVYPSGYDKAQPSNGGVIVNSPEEEAAAMGAAYTGKATVAPHIPEPEAPAPIVPVDTGERKFLTAILTKLGVEFNPDQPIIELRGLMEKQAHDAEEAGIQAADAAAKAAEAQKQAEDALKGDAEAQKEDQPSTAA